MSLRKGCHLKIIFNLVWFMSNRMLLSLIQESIKLFLFAIHIFLQKQGLRITLNNSVPLFYQFFSTRFPAW